MGEYREMSILIADGDVNVHQSLTAHFRREGYSTLSAYDGEQAVTLQRHTRPDIVILEAVMSKLDGLNVCREIRRESKVPIIMLTSKGDEYDKLIGFELGADDYITKPYSPREVLARVKAVMRRVCDSDDDAKGGSITIDNLEIDMGAFSVKLNGISMPCTPKEIEILWTLAGNPGMVFSRDHLLQSIWGYDFIGDTRAIDSHIKRIRAKLRDEGNRWDICTVWGVGYRFDMAQ